MTHECDRIGLVELTDYAARELSDADAAALEEHLFACPACSARAAEFDALVAGVQQSVRTAGVAGFMTEAMLNQLAREGVRVRTFNLSPGAVVPCAVWDGDELMALRMRGDVGDAREFTVSQVVAGTEIVRATAQIAPGALGELTYVVPADWIRQLPETDVEVRLMANEAGHERPVGTYTLVHGGSLHR